jgi:glycosyltransferase involved in cell wall biosynthesis
VAERKKRILWANPYCLLDLSSGASMTVREQLRQLHKLGWDVRVLGATIFDSPNGITRLAEHWEKIKKSRSKIVKVNDGPLTHNLIKTKSTQRSQMTAAEEAVWYQAYTKFLDEYKPDIVYYYGGRTLDLLIGDEAHARGIPVAAYLANGNFKGKRWCRDVDRVITNSKATAALYEAQDGVESVTIGPFVDPATVIAKDRHPKHVLAINPSLAKGAGIVAAVAIELEKKRPDIIFEIVESRGNWSSILTGVQKNLSLAPRNLSNVIITPNQEDMRPVYARAQIVLIMSLWWESLPRVGIEAILNHIPCIGTGHGGTPEAINDAGYIINLPSELHRPPYNKLPAHEKINEIAGDIIEVTDNEETRSALINNAKSHSVSYDLKQRGKKLSGILENLL